jgi:hypothetical protein
MEGGSLSSNPRELGVRATSDEERCSISILASSPPRYMLRFAGD